MQAQQKAVILARVSSKTQEDEGYSLDSQLKLLRNYCQKRQLNVVKEFKIAETASKAQRRTEFRALLAYIAEDKIQHFVVEKTDRAARNIKDASDIYDWIEGDEHRIFHSVKEGLELHKWSTSQVKFMWGIFVTFAKQYTDSLREEAMKGWDEKLAQGWLPAPPPPGYKTVTEYGKKIHVPDTDIAPIMEHIFKLAKLPDYNIRLITETLKDMGVTSRKGRPYAKSYVHKILTNPFYIGINRFNGKEYAGAQEPIISRELFYELQEKIHRPSYGRSKKHNPIFKGVIRCTDCGGTVTWQTQKGRSYGACRRASDVCKRWPMLREDRAEDQVIEVLNGIKDRNGDKLAKVSLALNIEQEVYASAYRARVMKALNAQLGRLRTMEDALYEDKLVGLISEERYREKLVDFADQAEQITARLAKLSEAQPAQVLDEDSRSKNKIAALYIRSVPNKKRIILSVLFAGAVLRDGFVVLELK
jgi:DNA invertase Pin-like site-specific DNA recombinase